MVLSGFTKSDFPNNGIFSLDYLKVFESIFTLNEKGTQTNAPFLTHDLELPGGACYKSWTCLQAS